MPRCSSKDNPPSVRLELQSAVQMPKGGPGQSNNGLMGFNTYTCRFHATFFHYLFFQALCRITHIIRRNVINLPAAAFVHSLRSNRLIKPSSSYCISLELWCLHARTRPLSPSAFCISTRLGIGFILQTVLQTSAFQLLFLLRSREFNFWRRAKSDTVLCPLPPPACRSERGGD